MANLLMILSWVLFYSLHTALASGKLKRFLEAKWPQEMKWYRLFYTVFSLVLFIAILVQALFLPHQLLVKGSPYLSYGGYMLATLGVVLTSRSLKEISLSSFIGLSGEDLGAREQLIIRGIYAKVRHPLYLGLVLIFLGYFLVSGTVGALIHLSCLIGYLPFGIYYEEKNLLKKYGSAYSDYRKSVPAIFPIKLKKGH
jgi:protein-S-isoprenylcysteine O-methyltransferase Ste14